MNNINQLHDKAMDLAEKAFLAKKKGNKTAFVLLSKEAFLLEKMAAMLLQHQPNAEPSRSILFKSAAFLAFDAEEFNACRDMITYTLLGKPDDLIRGEMNQLFDETTTILEKMPSKVEELKRKIARLDGGKEILRAVELQLA